MVRLLAKTDRESPNNKAIAGIVEEVLTYL
jgi:hypothetical protein